MLNGIDHIELAPVDNGKSVRAKAEPNTKLRKLKDTD